MNKSMIFQAALTDLANRYREAGYFPSASIRVFTGTETLAAVSVGEAREDSLFDVASLTKIATTTGILSLIDEGGIGMDDLIVKQFPEMENDPWYRERFGGITVRKMLTHTSTLPAWYPFYTWQGEDFWLALKSAVRNQLPSEGMVYSDLNFILLGKLLERKCRKSLPECLDEYVTGPLEIRDEMMYLPPESRRASIVPSCFDNAIEEGMCAERGLRFDHWRPSNTPVTGTVNDGNSYYYFGGVSGHAGIFATAGAYQKLCQAYMRTEKAIFREAQKEQSISPGRGLGFETGTVYPHGCGHKGFTGTSIYFSTEYDIGAVAMTNRLYYEQPSGHNMNEFRYALHEMTFSLAEALNGAL